MKGGDIMDITKTVAKLRLKYHLNMIDLVNIANQLKLMSDNKANNSNKHHFYECLDCYQRLGYPIQQFFEDES